MDDFNKNIVKWVSYDNEIKKYSSPWFKTKIYTNNMFILQPHLS